MNSLLHILSCEVGLIQCLQKKLPNDIIQIILLFILNSNIITINGKKININKLEHFHESFILKKILPLKKIFNGTFWFNIKNSRKNSKLKSIDLELFEINILLRDITKKISHIKSNLLENVDTDEDNIDSLKQKCQYLNYSIECCKLEKKRLFLLMCIIKLQIKRNNIKSELKCTVKESVKKPQLHYIRKHAFSSFTQETRIIHNLDDHIDEGRKNIIKKKWTPVVVMFEMKYMDALEKKYDILSADKNNLPVIHTENTIHLDNYSNFLQKWREFNYNEQEFLKIYNFTNEKLEKLYIKKQRTEFQKSRRLRLKEEKRKDRTTKTNSIYDFCLKST
jgi:hypothetical protein